MSKRCPSKAPGKNTLRHWQGRLFKNTYTHDGKQVELKALSVKIQHGGHRHTFCLSHSGRRGAAVEAHAIYNVIVEEGWEAALGRFSRRRGRPEPHSRNESDYWREHLLHRRYRFPADKEGAACFAARIDHGGRAYFFPLGSPDPAVAATRARDIYQTIVSHGWELAFQRFSRELTVGIEWASNPVLWSYTTIHTLTDQLAGAADAAKLSSDLPSVLVVDRDVGVRRSLMWCINQGGRFRAVPCNQIQHFSETVAHCRPQIVLLNRNLAGHLGLDPSQRWPLPRENILVLPYSVARDGDELFASTPGGAQGYVFTRVNPTLLLEPLCQVRNLTAPSSSEYQASIRSFFKYLLQPAQGDGPAGLGKLTRREHDVLGLLSKGYIDKEIAESLGISAWTVHDHIKDIFERLQVRTRSEAVARYLEK